jgi:WD40 repeat protein
MKTNRVLWRLGLILAGLILAAHALLTAGPRLVRTRTMGHPVPSEERGMRWAPVLSVAWSPDGKQLAASGGPGLGVRIWNSTTAEQEQVLLRSKDSISLVAWSPDGTRLASLARTYGSQPIRLWSRPTDRQRRWRNLPGPTAQWGMCRSVSWSPNGAWIASAWFPGGVQIRDARSGQIVQSIRRGALRAVWSPNSEQLALQDYQAVHIWDVSRGRELRRLDEPDGVDLDWSPDGKRLATASDKGTVRVWNLTTGQQSWDSIYDPTMPADGSPIACVICPAWITSIAWSPTGRLLAIAGADGDVCLWNAANGRERLRLHGDGWGTGFAVAWSPDGGHIAAGGVDGRLWVWDLAL